MEIKSIVENDFDKLYLLPKRYWVRIFIGK